MYEKILVPLDGSRLAELALPYAEEMAGRLNSEIILLSVASSAGAREYHSHEIYAERIVTETRHNAKRYLENDREHEIKVSSVTVVGNPEEAIVNLADEENVGLILMVAHGLSGIRRWALGSITDKVVRAVRQPVALIRAEDTRDVREKGILNRLLVLLDSSRESEAVLPYVVGLVSRLKTETTLFQVVRHPDKLAEAKGYLDGICHQLSREGVNARCEVRVGSPAEESIRLADEIDADMVAMATHGHSGVTRWTLGSVADKVIQAGNRSVLLVRTH